MKKLTTVMIKGGLIMALTGVCTSPFFLTYDMLGIDMIPTILLIGGVWIFGVVCILSYK